jgi:hypothetical protein
MSEDLRNSGDAPSPQRSGRTDPESTFRLLDRARSGDQEAVDRYESALTRLRPEAREAIIARQHGIQLRRAGRST